MKQTEGTLTLLGTGSSMGIPVVGCECSVCLSNNPKNTRNRCSALIQYAGKAILIDCGPDFHQQGLKYKLKSLDGVIFTHAHFDHIAGLDELRLFNFRNQKPLSALASETTLKDLKSRFAYIFQERKKEGNFTVQFDFTTLEEERGEGTFLGLDFRYFSYKQGTTNVSGFRFGDVAYVSDIKSYPESIFEDLKGLKTLVVSALRERGSHVHLTLEEAVSFSKKVGAQKTFFIHMDHEIEHETVNAKLPLGVELGYDDLSFSFSCPS
ncbi:Uncharacterized protein AB751O23_BE_00070 [Chlamydiales bacterium SCGC AB-751-O23]|jgi:phosphoribosyl 1,2-cyclic phosphate phosphodiesterase|nr:Uncharacterized protein AB751O23_BE_00070 [Chlamydiales bacterium SCGC AB-751-O23]